MSPPIYTPDGSEVSEIVLPDGSTASEVIDPDGNVVFEAGPDIPDSVLTQDLVAWYRFEDGDARDYTATLDATFADSTAYDGTVNNAIFQSSGGVTDFKVGSDSGSIDMTSNGFVAINSAATALQGESEISQMVWVNWNSDPNDGNDHNLIDSDSPNDFPNLYINDSDDGPVVIFGSVDTATSFNFNTSEWYHIAFSYSSTDGINLYVNSQLVSSTSATDGDVPTNLDDYIIGANGSGSKGFADAVFDDVRIYNRALTDAEISNIYNATEP